MFQRQQETNTLVITVDSLLTDLCWTTEGKEEEKKVKKHNPSKRQKKEGRGEGRRIRGNWRRNNSPNGLGHV